MVDGGGSVVALRKQGGQEFFTGGQDGEWVLKLLREVSKVRLPLYDSWGVRFTYGTWFALGGFAAVEKSMEVVQQSIKLSNLCLELCYRTLFGEKATNPVQKSVPDRWEFRDCEVYLEWSRVSISHMQGLGLHQGMVFPGIRPSVLDLVGSSWSCVSEAHIQPLSFLNGIGLIGRRTVIFKIFLVYGVPECGSSFRSHLTDKTANMGYILHMDNVSSTKIDVIGGGHSVSCENREPARSLVTSLRLCKYDGPSMACRRRYHVSKTIADVGDGTDADKFSKGIRDAEEEQEVQGEREGLQSCYQVGITHRLASLRNGLAYLHRSEEALRNEKKSETKQKDLLHRSEYVVTYVDKDGDRMLLDDVP
ncbi:auxin-responsive protein IAA9-like protein [Tanacetum coccineum]|uniref:Auxin-responsive protein n=1 Tax=Tanacetum coccineum TaxID=301880 RepID=A0ABQ5CEB6_9ASTR